MPSMCLFNMLMLLSPFLIICSTVIAWFSVSSVSFLCFCCLIHLLIRFVFQLLCMPGNYLSDTRHHKFAFARCWVFLELFSDAVRLLVSSLAPLRLTFKLVGTSSPWCDARVNLPLRYEPECPNTQYSRSREVCQPGREERELLSSLCGLWWLLHVSLFGTSLLISSSLSVHGSICSWSLRGSLGGLSLCDSLLSGALPCALRLHSLTSDPLAQRDAGLSWGFFSCAMAWQLSPHSQLRGVIGLISLVSFCSGVTVLHWCPESENCLMYFSLLS